MPFVSPRKELKYLNGMCVVRKTDEILKDKKLFDFLPTSEAYSLKTSLKSAILEPGGINFVPGLVLEYLRYFQKLIFFV